jgi:hypothetical protein
MDAATLDGTLDELRPRLLGQYLGRVRAASSHALVVELPRGARLWIEAAREIAGPYLLTRDEARALADEDAPVPGRARQALLLARKHLEGARVAGLSRVPGTRAVLVDAGRAALCLRLGGAAPALTLALDGAAVGTVGEGPPAWPPPDPDPDREWDRIDPGRFAAEVEEARARGWSDVRAHVSACPPLGPALARLVAAGLLSMEELRGRLARARPTLIAPRAPAACDDAELAVRGAVRLLPFEPPDAAGLVLHPPTWTSAGADYLALRLRGERFARQRQRRLEHARRRVQRLAQLAARLREDREGLPGADALRRDAQALLARGGGVPPGADHVEVPDPWDAERRLRIAVDGRLTLPVNADRLFDQARRIDRARRHLDQRLEAAGAELARARADEDAAQTARNLADLRGTRLPSHADGAAQGAGPRRYLTSRGLELVAGRGARENQKITFEVAGPDDWWLHARDVPGSHVVLRDPEGRASDDDLREAAEVAAFFSTAGAEARADVHATRRKHVRPGGGPGRVRVLHSQTLRVQPRDPEGRLRKR